jgi:ATP-dependent Lhr-like helicase
VQLGAWNSVSRGTSVLAVAPTGSGKTLAAFLVALSKFADGSLDPGALRVLYVSPLKALNEDIRLNLNAPLRGMREAANEGGLTREAARLAQVVVGSRSGDTSQAERRSHAKRPPSILAITPESLAIALNSPKARDALAAVAYVIVDELHALAGTKRGASLSASLGRLERLAGRFVRIGLSATVRPLERAADYLASRRRFDPAPPGFDWDGERGREAVDLVAPIGSKSISISVSYEALAPAEGALPKGPYAERETRTRLVARRIAAESSAHRGDGIVLSFVDSRRRAERLALLVNEEAQGGGSGEKRAYAHHGSLSKEIRRGVEARLRSGELACVVATSSLELGIDIGRVSLVALAGSPSTASGALQRIGRSGHSVGATSVGLLLPFHEADLLTGAAIAALAARREVEELPDPEPPLDVLAQILLGMIALDPWDADSLYGEVRLFSSFARLSRADFDATLGVLRGRYEHPAYRHLEARVREDPETGRLVASKGALGLLYLSGGTIPDRGYFQLRAGERGPIVGQLDEEFVWERRPGDSFTFGSTSWRVSRIDEREVIVEPGGRGGAPPPFWKAEARGASRALFAEVRKLLRSYDSGARDFSCALSAANLDEGARDALASFLASQRAAQGGVPLAAEGTLACEVLDGREGSMPALILHLALGANAHRAIAAALERSWKGANGFSVGCDCDDLAVAIALPGETGVEEAASMLRAALDAACGPGRLEGVVEGVRRTPAWGAAFREAAARSLLLPRASFSSRQPLWIARKKAKRLIEAVRDTRDFPLLAQADRDCLADWFDLTAFDAFAVAWQAGAVKLAPFVRHAASPFARGVAWIAENRQLYDGDAIDIGSDEAWSGRDAAIDEAIASDSIPFDPSGVDERRFMARLSGAAELGADSAGGDAVEWLLRRGACLRDEWDALLSRIPPLEARKAAGDERVAYFGLDGSSAVARAEIEPRLRGDTALLIANLLSKALLIELASIEATVGTDEAHAALASLEREGIVALKEREGARYAVDRENYALWLQARASSRRKSGSPRPCVDLAWFMASRQRLGPYSIDLTGSASGVSSSNRVVDLFGPMEDFIAPPQAWLESLLPERLRDFAPRELFEAVSNGGLLWYARGDRGVAFCRPDRYASFELLPRRPCALDGMPAPAGFGALVASLQSDPTALSRALDDEARAGLCSSDDFRAALSLYGRDAGTAVRGRGPMALKAKRARDGVAYAGSWFSLRTGDGSGDAFDEKEARDARVRAILDRYGVACRELCEREGGERSWSALAHSLRRMELSGELVAGRFFEDLEGVQYMRERDLQSFESFSTELPLAVRANDPASLAGLGALKLPRLAGSSACFIRGRLALTARRDGSELDLLVERGPDAIDALRAWTAAAAGWNAALGKGDVEVERISGVEAAKSPLARLFRDLGYEGDWRGLRFKRKPA